MVRECGDVEVQELRLAKWKCLFFAQVMRMTLSTLNWRRREMVRWLVTCATEVGESPTSL